MPLEKKRMKKKAPKKKVVKKKLGSEEPSEIVPPPKMSVMPPELDPDHPISVPKNVSEAKLRVMAEVAYIRKTHGGNLGYSYASEAEMIAGLRPSMVRHGLEIHPSEAELIESSDYKTQREKPMRLVRIRCVYILIHAPSRTSQRITVFGEASDSADKSIGKAMTLAYKYALRQAFMLETGDDPDISKEPVYPVSGHSGMSEREVLLARKDNHGLFKRAIAAIRKSRTHEELARYEMLYKSQEKGFDAEQIVELDRERSERALFLGEPVQGPDDDEPPAGASVPA